MRLVQLSANQATFKTVKFNKRGLTIVVGARSKTGQTYNGVGKSLIVELLHFCLGSSGNTEFESKIPGWEFTLEFELLGKTHSATRGTSEQDVVYLDHDRKKLSEYTTWLESRAFTIPPDVGNLSFRSLVPRFIRRGLQDYIDPRNPSDRTEYETLLRSAFLLGIEVRLIANKAALRKELVKVTGLKKNFKKDDLLRDFYSGGKDADLRLTHLDRQIAELDAARTGFVVAQNYYELQRSADSLAAEIENDKNGIFLTQIAITNIERSMLEGPDVPMERVANLYSEIAAAFRPETLRRLEDVAAFHTQLLKNRREKSQLGEKLARSARTLTAKQHRLDSLLRTLGQATALDQYTAVVNQIAALRAEGQKLRDYKAIQLEYSNRAADLEGQLIADIKRTNTYLVESKENREQSFQLFNQLVARFYPKAPAGITLVNDEGDNLTRFHLNVRIENDSSDGVNEVRIFCYDLALLILQHHHTVGFLVHDSRLFANMDVRQRATLFRTAQQKCAEHGLQYIATLNPDAISGMDASLAPGIDGLLTPGELKTIISDNVVLELKDNSPSGKLLGIQVDMRYDQK